MQEKQFKDFPICEEIQNQLQLLNFNIPTPIQAQSLEYSLQNKDIIGIAETGSGKTLAYVIPILHHLLNSQKTLFSVLCLAPTRELCLQIYEVFQAIGQAIGLKTIVIVGGLDIIQQVKAIQSKPHVIIAAPGRLIYHLTNTKGFNLENLKYLILDEADKLLDMDFEKQINQILDQIPKDRMTQMYSATMSTKIEKLKKACLNDPVKIQVNQLKTVSGLKQFYIFIPQIHKEIYLVYLLKQIQQKTLIFCNTCKQTSILTFMLKNLDFQVYSITGQMNQHNRISSINKFKSSSGKILIATDVAQRGLDIQNIQIVVNFDMPLNYKDYLQRVGRTARIGKSGQSISFITQYDIENIQRIENELGFQMEEYKYEEIQVLKYGEVVKKSMQLANEDYKEMLEKKKRKKK